MEKKIPDLVGRWDLSPFYTKPEPVALRLGNDRRTGKCSCQESEGKSILPSFMQCTKLDHCQLLIEKQFKVL